VARRFKCDDMMKTSGRRKVESLLALILLAAAALKTNQFLSGSQSSISIFINHKAAFAALIQSELLLALWLFVGGLPRLRFICAVACFALFAATSCYEAIHSMPTCGCFGNIKVPPALTAALDAAAVLALCLTRNTHIDQPSPRRLILAISAAVLLSAALWSVEVRGPRLQVLDASAGEVVVIEPTDWLNKPFTLLDDLPGSTPLRTGRWMLLMYHDDCDDCREAIAFYRAAHGSVYRLALLALPPLTAPVTDLPDELRLTLNPNQNWFATTPVVFALDNARVIAAAAGPAAIHPPIIPQWHP